jgi:hypothetical protein
MSDESETVTVWRAPRNYRIGAAVAVVILLLLSVNVLVLYGYLALIGVVLVLAVVAQTWWNLLRPKLTAGPDGVDVVSGRTPVHLDWSEIRRCEPTTQGLKIVGTNGREVLSRFPQQRAANAASPTEADATAAYLAQRAAWARKSTGPAPTYTAPPSPAKAVRAKPARS